MQTQSNIEMFVLTGEQAGARTRLENNASFTVSGELDTDVVFRDPMIKDERLNIITKNNELFIEVLSGDIEIQGKKFTKGKQIKVPEYAKVKIGETTFAYGRKQNATWREVVDYVSQLEISALPSNGYSRPITSKTSAYTISALLFVIAVALILYHVNNKTNDTDELSMLDINNIHSILIEHGIESLQVHQPNTGEFMISGFLMTNREKSIVESVVDQYKIPALIDLYTGDQLAMEVRELYRVNGIDAEVKALNRNAVIVTTDMENHEHLQKIKGIALNEIPGLHDLDTEYLHVNQSPQTIGSNEYDKDDKRITMVVDGDPAYLMTSDQSKYYVGAILPTGHKIIDISKQQVTLEKEGLITALNF